MTNGADKSAVSLSPAAGGRGRSVVVPAIGALLILHSLVGGLLVGWRNIAELQPGGIEGSTNLALFRMYTLVIAAAYGAGGSLIGWWLIRGRAIGRAAFLWYWPTALLVQWFMLGMQWSNPLAWPLAGPLRYALHPLKLGLHHLGVQGVSRPDLQAPWSAPEGHLGSLLVFLAGTFLLLHRSANGHFGRPMKAEVVNRAAPLIVLACIYAFFAAIGPENFSSLYQAQTTLRQSAIVCIAGLGMTVIMIAGGIDLSIGSLVALTTMVVAWVLRLQWEGQSLLADHPVMWPLAAALAGVAVAGVGGVINGAAVVVLRVVPFIVTLGTLLMFRGVARGVGGDRTINTESSWLSSILQRPAEGYAWLIFAPGVWLAIALAVVVGLVLSYTRFGRHVFAVGSNEQTARLCGVSVPRVKLLVYTIGATLTGIAGVMQFSRLGRQGDPTIAGGLELDVIAAVVIGGGSLSGGEGSVLGTLMGALIMSTIAVGCSQLGLPPWVQMIVTGMVLISAAGLDRLRQERFARG